MTDTEELMKLFYAQVTENFGSALTEVAEEAFHVMGSIAAGTVVDIDIDGELFDFMTCTFEPEEPIWEFVCPTEEV